MEIIFTGILLAIGFYFVVNAFIALVAGVALLIVLIDKFLRGK